MPRAAGRWRVMAAVLAAAALQPAFGAVETASAAATITLQPTADTWADSSLPSANFGSSNRLKVRTASKRFESYLRFTVTGVGALSSARLRLFVADGSADGGTVYRTTDDWSENGLTWATRPAPTGPALAAIGAAAAKSWVDIDVGSLVDGPGTYSFLITGGISDAVGYHSRENTSVRRPQLVLTTAETAPQPPVNVAPPTISAPTAERSVHFALPGTWAGEAPIGYAFQWLRCLNTCEAIPGATGDRFELGPTEIGARLAVTVTATNAGGTATARSAESAPVPPRSEIASGDPVVAVAGDIACDPDGSGFNGGSGTATECRQLATSDLLVDRGLAAVLIPGDLQYDVGDYGDFLRSYDLSWGRASGITRPSPGNHEYGTIAAGGYYRYFDAAAGAPSEGWYSFTIGSWLVLALNSNCDVVACGAGSAQVAWLRGQLASSSAACTLAFWHHPRFSSGVHGADSDVSGFWDVLYEYGADLVVNGHDHHYERFAPLTPAGVADAGYGIREFVVGTGGKSLRAITAPIVSSEARNDTDYGVLDLTLGAAGYSWAFRAIAGQDYTDSGTGICHGPPGGTPPTPANDALVTASVETQPVPHAMDSADDAAIWVNPVDPGQSAIIGTDKQPGGGLAVYDLAGNELHFHGGVAMNNVDLIDSFPMGGALVPLVVATDRDSNALAVFRLDPATRTLVNVASRLITGAGAGVCTYRSPTTGSDYAFTASGSGVVKQWRLFATTTGTVDATLVRKFDVGEAAEGCVADDARGHVYVSEELVGIWRYGAEPSDTSPRLQVDATGTGGHLTPHVEGLALVETDPAGGSGYLVASSQGDDRFVIYRRDGYAFVGSFRVVQSGAIDGAESTDGIEVAPVALGPAFPGGVFVAQDGNNVDGGLRSNHNFKLVSWAAVLEAVGEAGG